MTQLALDAHGAVHTDLVEGQPESTRAGDLLKRVSRPVASLKAVPNLGTWSGVLLSTVGAILLVIAWGRTAGLTEVARQIPYVVSAGFTGLGLVAVGLTVINISAKRADAVVRTRQIGELHGLLAEMRKVVEGTHEEDGA
jgi:hypothetical protein